MTAAAIPPRGLIVSILVLASSVSIMSTDMYTPSLPDLARWFDTSATMVQLTISLNLVAFALAQLLHGPLSDRFGRRPVLIAALVCVALLCIACAQSASIYQLIVFRILLGIAAAAEAVIGLAILKDLYEEQDQMRALALLNMVIAVTPAIAPIIGGYLHVHFGWQSNFQVIAVMALSTALIAWRWLPESTTPDQLALRPARLATGYGALLRNSDFVLHTLLLGGAMGLIFVFITGAPFVLINQLGVAVEHFGFYQMAIVMAFFFGSLLSSRLLERVDATRLLQLGVSLQVLGVAVLATLTLFFAPGAAWVTVPFALMTFGLGPVFTVAPSRALRHISGGAGMASAMLACIEQGIAGLASLLVSLLSGGLETMLLVTVLLLILMLWCLQRTGGILAPP